MKWGQCFWLVVTCSLIASTGADAGGLSFFTGNDLWALCGSNLSSDQFACLTYVVGIADAMNAPPKNGTYYQQEGLSGFQACLRPSMTRQQVADVVRLYLENHPEERDETAAGLVAFVLATAFPCPK
jgi:hypothetical protein